MARKPRQPRQPRQRSLDRAAKKAGRRQAEAERHFPRLSLDDIEALLERVGVDPDKVDIPDDLVCEIPTRPTVPQGAGASADAGELGPPVDVDALLSERVRQRREGLQQYLADREARLLAAADEAENQLLLTALDPRAAALMTRYRYKAITALIDRVHGKATVRVQVDPAPEVGSHEDRVARMEQLAALASGDVIEGQAFDVDA